MSHVRTQIRARFSTLLAALGATYEVTASRKRPKNIDHGIALVNIRCLNDQTQAREVQSDLRIRIASVYVRIQRSGSGDALDDTLDADEVAVVDAILGAEWADLLEEPPELLQTNFSDDGAGELDIAEIVMRFDCEYRVDRTDLENVFP